MKKLLLTAILALFSPLCGAQSNGVAIHSFQDTSCGTWSASATQPLVRAQYLAWFRGFVSGWDFAKPKHQVGLNEMPDNATLSLFVDKYCREHPLNPFISAAFPLIRELTQSSKSSAN